MFLANYMHRDISAANLLFFPTADDGPSGKIGDLEYAKQFGVFLDGAKSDPKTVRMNASDVVVLSLT